MKQKLELLFSNCSVRPWPSLYKDDEGRYYIQGYITPGNRKVAAGDNLRVGEDIVEVDAEFIEKLKNIL